MRADALVLMEAMSTERNRRKGVVDCLDRFLRSVENQAFKMASYATREKSPALDIVQEAMTAFVRRYSGKPSDEWRPLFFRTLDSKIKDWYRRRRLRLKWFAGPTKRLAGAEVEIVDLAADPAALDPARVVDAAAAGAALERALCALPDRQRQAFLLRTWLGMSGAETAAVMRCSEGSVKTHLSRAMTSLREKLEVFR